jgi:protein farnesyltransferase subunit beta
MGLEGGFQGRTNKLVDGCYSFWGAGDFPIIRAELNRSLGGGNATDYDYLFDREALQEYILLCCQSDYGGLIDKPGKPADYYHTCYCLSGLSVSQHSIQYDVLKANELDTKTGGLSSLMWNCENEFIIVGDVVNNSLAPTHPIHNITLRAARNMIHYFYDTKDLVLPVDEGAEEY